MQKNSVGKSRFLAIIQAMSEGVLLVSGKHRIALSNTSAEKLLPWASPLHGKDISQVFSSEALLKSLEKVEAKGKAERIKITSWKSNTGEKAVVKGKGREKRYSISISPLDDKFSVITISDITEMERLSLVRQDFVSNVSHELKTPLTAISGFAETLAESELDSAETKRFASIILKNTTHMQRIISDLLLLTSLDRTEIETAMDDAEDTAIFQEVRAYTQYKADQKSIKVNYHPSGKKARCQSSLIVQAVINLVVNAISYSGENTEVDVSSRERDGMLEIKVSDYGVGIAQEDIPRIFERFYRVDKARSRESGGTGLGLSIVRHIAILHAGTIKAESELGKGSVFTLSIPIR